MNPEMTPKKRYNKAEEVFDDFKYFIVVPGAEIEDGPYNKESAIALAREYAADYKGSNVYVCQAIKQIVYKPEVINIK